MASNAKAPFAATGAWLVDRLEVARVLGISPGSVDNARLRGELRSLKIGARRLFDMDDVRKYVEARKLVRE